MQSHLEARLWNDVFMFTEEQLGLAAGSIRATVLIETVPAAFQMDEILFELRDHSAGLNAGRWDYMFSAVKTFAKQDRGVLPDRRLLTMTVPFMRAYTELLVHTCHRRGAHAIGGMAALIPNRRMPMRPQTPSRACRRTSVARRGTATTAPGSRTPTLWPQRAKRSTPFSRASQPAAPPTRGRGGDRARLLDLDSAGHDVSEAGVRNNISVSLRYLTAWFSGNGAVGVFNLMEDVATAEICRSQLWQWLHRGVSMTDGRTVTRG